MAELHLTNTRIAVVIPCFKVRSFILDVVASIPAYVEKIFVIDDACPEKSGEFVLTNSANPKVEVIFNPVNLGVGGAVMEGYKKAFKEGFQIIVKIDGDGQMDASKIKNFVLPIIHKEADYTKGNRFYNPYFLRNMPKSRLVGNAVLSLVTKLSSGYWNSFDPTNGFTAISSLVLQKLPLERINKRYFFESDILFRLNIIRAVVADIPIDAKYGNEQSNLKISENILPFIKGNAVNFIKRIAYNYYLRNFSLASLQLLFGILLTLFGFFYGLSHWGISELNEPPATAGTVMVAALPIIVGFQLLMSFINYDINTVPRRPLTKILEE